MLSVFYIGKRTLLDILRTALFWVAVGIALFASFTILYWGWRAMKADLESQGFTTDRPIMEQMEEERGHGFSGDPDGDFPLMELMDPEKVMIQVAYAKTINIANLLAIFIMIGLLGREVDRRTIDILLARPVSRGQVFLGKLVGGWVAIVIFVALIACWSVLCQMMGGMRPHAQEFFSASAVGVLQPLVLGAVTLTLTTWMRGVIAGLITTVTLFISSNGGLWATKMIGVSMLKLKLPVWVLFKVQPPLNVIGHHATDHFQKDVHLAMLESFFRDMAPSVQDGLYSEMWQVWAYLGVVILLGWLSFFRRQFG